MPSSNTALEPLTQAIVASISDAELQVSVHFSRFHVTQISLSSDSNAQFDHERIVNAAQLLADAKVDVIGWSGTSSGWLGFDNDQRLCAAIKQRTGVPTVTSTLALNEILKKLDARELGLVTPYTKDVNDRIRSNYARIGVQIDDSIEQHWGGSVNTEFANIPEHTLDEMVAQVARAGAPVVTTFCTNLVAAQRVEYWEQTHNIVVLDTVATVVWDMLRAAGLNTGLVQGWGRLFSLK